MRVRAIVLFIFLGISYDIFIRNCSGIKHHCPCFCTNEIHITVKHFSEKADGTLEYHNYHLFNISMAHISWGVFILRTSTSSGFPHPLCTNEHGAENVLYGILSCYHLYSSFPVDYVYIITCFLCFVQSLWSIESYKNKLYTVSFLWYCLTVLRAYLFQVRERLLHLL